jgi:hypothetical protein
VVFAITPAVDYGLDIVAPGQPRTARKVVMLAGSSGSTMGTMLPTNSNIDVTVLPSAIRRERRVAQCALRNWAVKSTNSALPHVCCSGLPESQEEADPCVRRGQRFLAERQPMLREPGCIKVFPVLGRLLEGALLVKADEHIRQLASDRPDLSDRRIHVQAPPVG